MGFDSENKKKKCIITGVISALLVVMVVSIAIIMSKNISGSNKSVAVQIKTTTKAVEAVCAPTDFKETCVNSLMKASPNSTQPLDLIKLAFDITIRSIKDGIKKASAELKAKAAKDNETKGALELCEKLMTDATDDLKKCFDHFDGFSITQIEDFVENLRVWLSGSIAYQQTCMDTFEEIKSSHAQDMHKIFKTSKELTSNGLAMITNISSLLGEFNITGNSFRLSLVHLKYMSMSYNEQYEWTILPFWVPGLTGDLGNYARKLLSTEDGIPSWVGPETRRLMATKGGVKANVVVAQDGSGQYKSINEALNDVPKNNNISFVIYIKQGVYKEKVDVTKKMTHVTFIGDGPTKTKITGSLNFAIGKVKTYQTATVGESNSIS